MEDEAIRPSSSADTGGGGGNWTYFGRSGARGAGRGVGPVARISAEASVGGRGSVVWYIRFVRGGASSLCVRARLVCCFAACWGFFLSFLLPLGFECERVF